MRLKLPTRAEWLRYDKALSCAGGKTTSRPSWKVLRKKRPRSAFTKSQQYADSLPCLVARTQKTTWQSPAWCDNLWVDVGEVYPRQFGIPVFGTCAFRVASERKWNANPLLEPRSGPVPGNFRWCQIARQGQWQASQWRRQLQRAGMLQLERVRGQLAGGLLPWPFAEA